MNRQIATFSFLATINNGYHSINSLVKVYEPIVKIVIGEVYKKGILNIMVEDFMEEILNFSGVKLPIPLVEEIIIEFSKQEIVNYTNDNTIQIKRYSFESYIETYEDNAADIIFIEEDFKSFLRSNNAREDLSFYDFIELYQSKIKLFTKKETEMNDIEPDFEYHLKYLKSAYNDKKIIGIIKKIFWGILVTYFFTDNSKASITFKNCILLIDTSFFISLLGLHSDISNTICKEVYDLAKQLGFKFHMFDETVNETRRLLVNTATKLRNNIKPSEIYDNDITRACFSNINISSTDLEMYAKKIEDYTKLYDIKIQYMEKLKHKVEKSKLYNYYIEVAKKDEKSAIHDASAIEYVKSCRGKSVYEVEDAKCWFLQDKKNNYNTLYKNDETINEVISSHDLLLLLWLTTPQNLNLDRVSEIELTKLIATSTAEFTPDKGLLKEFEDNFEKYRDGELSEEDVAMIYFIVGQKTTKEVKSVNFKEDNEFMLDMKTWIKKFKEETEQAKIADEFIIDKLSQEVSSIYQLYHQEYEKRMFEKQDKSIVIDEKDYYKVDLIKSLEELISTKEKSIENYENKKKAYHTKLDKRVLIAKFIILFISLFVFFFMVYYKEGWQNVEPILSIIPAVLVLFDYLLRILGINNGLCSWYIKHRISKFDINNNFSETEFEAELSSIEKLQEELKLIKETN